VKRRNTWIVTAGAVAGLVVLLLYRLMRREIGDDFPPLGAGPGAAADP
jgi:hypothetical protein